MQSWNETTASNFESMLGQALPESSELFTKGLGMLDEVFGTTLVKQQEMEDAQKALVDQFAKTGDLDAFQERAARYSRRGFEGNERRDGRGSDEGRRFVRKSFGTAEGDPDRDRF
jgi:hypothetical protein